MIDKKIKYAIQGGGPNYLGKQKMVKAPKKWKSSPDHPDTELAYITEPEKQVLIALNLHGGLEEDKAAAQRAMQDKIAAAEKQQAAKAAKEKAAKETQSRMSARKSTQKPGLSLADKIGYTQHMKEDRMLKDAAIDNQLMNRMGGFNVTQANPALGLKNPFGPGIGMTMLGGAAAGYQGIQSLLGDQSIGEAVKDTYENIMGAGLQAEPEKLAKYNQILGTNIPPSDPGFSLMGKAQAATPGYQNIFQTGAVSQTPPKEWYGGPDETPLRTRIQDDRAEDIRRKALANIALQTDKSLTDISDPSRQGIMSGFADTGKSMIGNQLKKAATSFALNKLGLGFLNPAIGLASLFGFDPVGSLMAKMPKGTGTKTAWAGPSEEDLRGGDQNVIQAGIEKFQPTDQQTAQMTELMRKRMILQGYADKGALNEQGMNTLAQMNQLINQFQVDPASIWGVA